MIMRTTTMMIRGNSLGCIAGQELTLRHNYRLINLNNHPFIILLKLSLTRPGNINGPSKPAASNKPSTGEIQHQLHISIPNPEQPLPWRPDPAQQPDPAPNLQPPSPSLPLTRPGPVFLPRNDDVLEPAVAPPPLPVASDASVRIK